MNHLTFASTLALLASCGMDRELCFEGTLVFATNADPKIGCPNSRDLDLDEELCVEGGPQALLFEPGGVEFDIEATCTATDGRNVLTLLQAGSEPWADNTLTLDEGSWDCLLEGRNYPNGGCNSVTPFEPFTLAVEVWPPVLAELTCPLPEGDWVAEGSTFSLHEAQVDFFHDERWVGSSKELSVSVRGGGATDGSTINVDNSDDPLTVEFACQLDDQQRWSWSQRWAKAQVPELACQIEPADTDSIPVNDDDAILICEGLPAVSEDLAWQWTVGELTGEAVWSADEPLELPLANMMAYHGIGSSPVVSVVLEDGTHGVQGRWETTLEAGELVLDGVGLWATSRDSLMILDSLAETGELDGDVTLRMGFELGSQDGTLLWLGDANSFLTVLVIGDELEVEIWAPVDGIMETITLQTTIDRSRPHQLALLVDLDGVVLHIDGAEQGRSDNAPSLDGLAFHQAELGPLPYARIDAFEIAGGWTKDMALVWTDLCSLSNCGEICFEFNVEEPGQEIEDGARLCSPTSDSCLTIAGGFIVEPSGT